MMEKANTIDQEIAATEEKSSSQFLLAGGIYGGKIVLITETTTTQAIFITYDESKQEGMIITKEEVPDAFNIQTIYITHTTDKGSVRHIIEPIIDISKKDNNIIHYKGKLAL